MKLNKEQKAQVFFLGGWCAIIAHIGFLAWMITNL